MMSLEKLSKRVVGQLDDALADNIAAEQREAILEIVRREMRDSSSRTTRDMKATAVICCGPEADKA